MVNAIQLFVFRFNKTFLLLLQVFFFPLLFFNNNNIYYYFFFFENNNNGCIYQKILHYIGKYSPLQKQCVFLLVCFIIFVY